MQMETGSQGKKNKNVHFADENSKFEMFNRDGL